MRIKINGIEWSVSRENPEYIKKQSVDGEGYYFGLTDFRNLSIYVNNEIARDLAKATVFHELVHAYKFSIGFRNDELTEEDLCNFMAHHAEAIIDLRNKVVATLFKKLSEESFVENLRKASEAMARLERELSEAKR